MLAFLFKSSKTRGVRPKNRFKVFPMRYEYDRTNSTFRILLFEKFSYTTDWFLLVYKKPKDPTSETKIRDCSFAQNHARMILAWT